MRIQANHLRLLLTLGSALLCVSIQAQTPTGQWDFNNSNLVATVGGNLTYADGSGGPTELGTQFGTTASFGITAINSSNAVVMRFPAATNGMGYLMPTPAAANGGGSLVNQWTLIMDVLYPPVSDGVNRPLIDTDGSVFTTGPDFIVSASGGIGSPPGGPFNGSLLPNTWYRIGIAVTSTTVDTFINGAPVGSTSGAGLDNRFGLTANSTALILGSTTNSAGVGYVNSIQLRDVALNAGQMLAIGGPSATGIPQTIPPVPAFIQTRTPGVNANGVLPSPNVHVVLNQGDTTVNSGSIQLLLDGQVLPSTVTPTPPTFDVTASITNLLDPNSLHTLSLVWQDNVAGTTTTSWSFTVFNYQNINLPAPFYSETFDELTENPTGPGPLPTGWSVTNATSPSATAGYDLDTRNSDSYLDWVLVSSDRYQGWGASRTRIPPIVVNGQLLSSLASGNLMWAESDQRCGGCNGQYQEMYTSDIDCTGKTNVFVSWKSIYMQNQDNMNLCEFSIDQGTNWLPVRYMFCAAGNGEASDIYYTNDASGTPVIDVGATFNTVDNNRNFSFYSASVGTNYGAYVKAPISTNLIPYIFGYTNDAVDDNLFPYSGMEVVVVRIPKADGQKNVRFRFLDDGTSAWYWGIDDFGLYEINTPIILTPPADQMVSAGSTATFTVVAQSATPLKYQWQHAGTNLSNGGHFSGVTNATLTVSNCETNDAGVYTCLVGNLYGNVPSPGAKLTVVAAPLIITQPTPAVVSPGFPASFTVAALGRPPLSYQWLRDGTPVGPNSSTLSISAVQLSDAGRYQVNITNTEGQALSTGVRLIVSPSTITGSLVIHLKFDGDYTDSSGRTNDAAPVGSPTFAAGKLGQAMKFTTKQDGSEFDYASLGYPDDLKFGSDTDFTISFWANYSQQVDDPPLISNKDWLSSDNRGWGIFTQPNGHLRINSTGTGGTKYDLGSSSTPLVGNGAWHNVLLSYARGAIVTLYVDGVPANTRADLTTGSIDTDDLSYAVNIGQDGTGGYTDHGGAGITNALIDDVGIWRRALSAQEASAVYTAGQSGKDLSQAAVAAKVTLTATLSGGALHLSWPANPNVQLQQSTSLSSPSWSNVPGTLGAGSATVPITGGATFFRLAQ
jgi:hypothetical protein